MVMHTLTQSGCVHGLAHFTCAIAGIALTTWYRLLNATVLLKIVL